MASKASSERHVRSRRLLAVAGGAVLLGGCASTPESLQGEFSSLEPTTATTADTGERVRWGGRLLEVRPEREQTCFEILSQPLGSNARPDTSAGAGRRFLACRDGFADPAAYPAERSVTVTGVLSGFTTRAIGEYEYRFPRVEAESIHLWPEPRQYESYPMPWWHDPYYPWGPGYSWGPGPRYWH